MRKLFLLITILLLSYSSIAQNQSKDSVIRSTNDIWLAFINNYAPNVDSVKNNCWQGCVFIRFNITNEHKLTNIAYTTTTPVFIKNAIEKAMIRLDKRTVDIDQLKGSLQRTYILPLIITNNAGCGFMTGWEDNHNQNKIDEKKQLRYKQLQEDYNQFGKSIENIINFSDGHKMDFVDCILLAPV